MERDCSTGQSPQRAVAPTEEEQFGVPFTIQTDFPGTGSYRVIQVLQVHILRATTCSVAAWNMDDNPCAKFQIIIAG